MSKIANGVRSIIPAVSRICRCSALMIGDHQRESHSAVRGITASPNFSTSGAFTSYQNGPLPTGGLVEDRPEGLLLLVVRR